MAGRGHELLQLAIEETVKRNLDCSSGQECLGGGLNKQQHVPSIMADYSGSSVVAPSSAETANIGMDSEECEESSEEEGDDDEEQDDMDYVLFLAQQNDAHLYKDSAPTSIDMNSQQQHQQQQQPPPPQLVTPPAQIVPIVQPVQSAHTLLPAQSVPPSTQSVSPTTQFVEEKSSQKQFAPITRDLESEPEFSESEPNDEQDEEYQEEDDFEEEDIPPPPKAKRPRAKPKPRAKAKAKPKPKPKPKPKAKPKIKPKEKAKKKAKTKAKPKAKRGRKKKVTKKDNDQRWRFDSFLAQQSKAILQSKSSVPSTNIVAQHVNIWNNSSEPAATATSGAATAVASSAVPSAPAAEVVETMPPGLSVPPSTGRPKRGRKRKVPNQSRADRKILYNHNKTYVNTKGVLVKPKTFDASFICKCPKKCTDMVSVEDRQKIFTRFWSMGTYEGRCAVINSCVIELGKLRCYTTRPSKRNKTRRYCLNGKWVCKVAFLKTLQISQNRIDTALAKNNDATFSDNRRGRSGGKNRIPVERLQEVIQHIDSFPKSKSERSRSESDPQYLSAELNLQKLYNLYVEKVANPVSLSYYKRVFYDKFNLRFKTAKKDTSHKTAHSEYDKPRKTHVADKHHQQLHQQQQQQQHHHQQHHHNHHQHPQQPILNSHQQLQQNPQSIAPQLPRPGHWMDTHPNSWANAPSLVGNHFENIGMQLAHVCDRHT